MACFDIMGKATGRPVCDLLGGRVRDVVPFSAYLFYKLGRGRRTWLRRRSSGHGVGGCAPGPALTPDEVVVQAQAMCDSIRLPVDQAQGRRHAADEEVDAMLALREAFGPDVPLRLDPNAIWRVETAIEMGRRLEGVLEYYEDPVRGQEAMAEVGAAAADAHGDQHVHDLVRGHSRQCRARF